MQQVFQDGNLNYKLLRHRLACPLVRIIHFMAEGGRVYVKRDHKMCRLFFLDHLEDELHEAEDAVGGQTFLGRKGRYRIECAV